MLFKNGLKRACIAAALASLLTPAACAQKAPPAGQDVTGTQKQMEAAILGLREFLYCDRTLDQAVESAGDDEDEKLKQALALVAAGDARGAVKLLDEMNPGGKTAGDMQYWFAVAKAKRAAGDADGAKRAARRPLSDAETRVVLQAWSVLRELGERPPAEAADKVLGVVAEVGVDEGVMIIAGYQDGESRIFWTTGGGLIGTPTDDKVIAAAKELARAGQPLAAQLPYATDRPLPKPKRVRFSLLTPGGMRVGEEGLSAADGGSSKFSPLHAAAMQLMHELLRVYKQKEQGQ
ncbi:MAG TPA: hypothetical protein VGX48_01385 [Pyrinomonadaceae bacterium]|jgi:hypothetical protein|nr:hypothetical protein [Pyrinomonadaceae bacterium]